MACSHGRGEGDRCQSGLAQYSPPNVGVHETAIELVFIFFERRGEVGGIVLLAKVEIVIGDIIFKVWVFFIHLFIVILFHVVMHFTLVFNCDVPK